VAAVNPTSQGGAPPAATDSSERRPFIARRLAAVIAATIAAGVVAGLAQPTFVLALAGLLPSLVVFVASSSARRTLLHTVAPINLAGVAPVIFELWSRGHALETALHLLSEVETLALMYGAAAGGWLLAWLSPKIAYMIADIRWDYRLKALDAREGDLREEWDFSER
jgi:hypothetical protein